MGETGYAKIEKALKPDKLALVEDIIVTIRRNGDVINELLSPGQVQGRWEWVNDWWEGEEDVQFIGAKYLRYCSCFGNRLEYVNGGDKQRWPVKGVEIDHFKITARCPFCHSRKAKLVSKKAPCGHNERDDVVFRQRSYVRCMKCGARGPLASGNVVQDNGTQGWLKSTREINKEAVEKWNGVEEKQCGG